MIKKSNESFFKEFPPFTELQKYSESELKKIIGDNDSLLKELQKYEYIKFDKKKQVYTIKFVGIMVINDMIFRCYPKYIPQDEQIPQNQKEDSFKETMRVIRKYHKLKSNFNQDNIEAEDAYSSMISLMIFFIEDYYENGIYTNYQTRYEINGEGEINWDKTINNKTPLIKNKKPYYVELETRYNLNNTKDFFRLLHEFIITDCSKKLEDVGLLELLDLIPIKISKNKLSDFGEMKEILNKLEKERNIEFNTHKRKLLKQMHNYISQEKTYENKNTISVYGTTKYNVIWEDICCRVLKDKLKQEIINLKKDLPNQNLNLDNYKNQNLKEIIEKPKWIFETGKSFETYGLIPDLITFYEDTFVILDAKYYDITFEEDELKGQPGLESVTKQYLYELAYKEFIKVAGFENVINAFLFPTYDSKNPAEKQKVIKKGRVKLKFLTDIPLEEIQVIMLPVSRMNKLYLQNKHMEKSELKLDD